MLADLLVAQAAAAAAVGVAVSRHGLYEIDRLINRTLVYARAHRAARPVLRRSSRSASACSRARLRAGRPRLATLAVAALFRPVRAQRAGAGRPALRPRRASTGVRLVRAFRGDVREAAREAEDVGAALAPRSAIRGAEVLFRLPESGDLRRRHGRARAAPRGRPRAHRATARDRELGAAAARPGARASAGPARERARRGRGDDRDRAPARRGPDCSSPRSRPRASGSSRPATRSGGGSSATSTTAPSSGSCPSASRCGGCSARCPPEACRPGARRGRRRDRPTRSPTCGRSPPACGPPRLDEGLAAALADSPAAPVPVDARAPATERRRQVEAAAYFVACEALTNAVKHASRVARSPSSATRNAASS